MPRLSITSLAGAILYAFVCVVAQAQSQTSGLPDDAGKQRVEGVCTACHQINQITRSSGYTLEGWKELTSTMIDLAGSPENQGEITKYLATHFPPNTRRAPKLMPGDVQIAFKEWTVPTLGQRARDPIQAADGSIWWAGQWGNLIGRIDPASGEMNEYPLPQGSMPHSVTVDHAGNVWYTGNKNATVGKLDPNTGKDHRLQDARARRAKDPHTAIFDEQGILWFTLQHSNMVGRLNPATGDIKLVSMKTPGSRPYGIKIDARGRPVGRLQRQQLPGQGRPGDDGAHGDQIADTGDDGSASRHRERRHDLVRQFVSGSAWPVQPEDRQNPGVAVSQRAEVPSLRAGGRGRHRLV